MTGNIIVKARTALQEKEKDTGKCLQPEFYGTMKVQEKKKKKRSLNKLLTNCEGEGGASNGGPALSCLFYTRTAPPLVLGMLRICQPTRACILHRNTIVIVLKKTSVWDY